MKALKADDRSRKRKDGGGGEETPRPVKKARMDHEGAEFAGGNVFTPGGGPGVKLPRHGLDEEEEGAGVLDDGDTISVFDDDAETEDLDVSTTGLDGANASVLQEDVAGDTETHSLQNDPTDDSERSMEDVPDVHPASPNKPATTPTTAIPAIELIPATKRKSSMDGGEVSTRPTQVLRTEEDLGDEQTPTLNEMTYYPVTDRPDIELTPATKRKASINGGEVSDRPVKVLRADEELRGEQSLGLEADAPGDILANNSDDEQDMDASTDNQELAPPAPTEVAKAKSRLPVPKPAKPVPPTSPRKSARIAAKPAMTLNENVLSKRSVSPKKRGKELGEEKEKEKEKGKSRESKSPSKARAKSPEKSPAKSRMSTSPSKSKTGK